MKESTRQKKESRLIEAAARVMEQKGLSTFTMEDVADEGDVTKVTLYSYFDSKENLTMAVSNQIFNELNEAITNIIARSAHLDGIESCLNIKSGVLDFVIEKPFRAAMIMEFISIFNMPEDRLTEAMAHSENRITLEAKTRELSDLVNKEIERGRQDGSIQSKTPSNILFMYVWNCITGFISMTRTPGFRDHVSETYIKDLIEYQEYVARNMLSTPLYPVMA